MLHVIIVGTLNRNPATCFHLIPGQTSDVFGCHGDSLISRDRLLFVSDLMFFSPLAVVECRRSFNHSLRFASVLGTNSFLAGPYIARGQRGQLPPQEKLNSVSNIILITRKSTN